MIRTLTSGLICCAVLAALLAAAAPARAQSEDSVKKYVTQWLKERIARPETYQDLGWSSLVKHPDGAPFPYSIRHVYGLVTSQGEAKIYDVIFSFDGDGRIASREILKRGVEPRQTPWRP